MYPAYIYIYIYAHESADDNTTIRSKYPRQQDDQPEKLSKELEKSKMGTDRLSKAGPYEIDR